MARKILKPGTKSLIKGLKKNRANTYTKSPAQRKKLAEGYRTQRKKNGSGMKRGLKTIGDM